MKIDKRLDAYLSKYQPFQHKSLEIVLNLHSPPILYNPLHLDGLLSKAVVDAALQTESLAPSAEPYWLPLPLVTYWKDTHGLPLWAATDFQSIDTDTTDAEFWHKRAVDTAMLPKTRDGRPLNLRTAQGVTKEYRIPVPVHSSLRWKATCNGDPHAIRDLLATVTAVGKKRSQGYGRVKSWELTEIDAFTFFDESLHALRPIPTVALTSIAPAEYPLKNLGMLTWTPPYWRSNAMLLCLAPHALQSPAHSP